MDYSKEFIELKEEIDELRQALIDVLDAPLTTSGPSVGLVKYHFHTCSPSRMKMMTKIKERLQASRGQTQ